MIKSALLTIIIFSVSFSFNLGISVSNYDGPSLGLTSNFKHIAVCIDGIYKTEMNEIEYSNYNYSELNKFENKTTKLGIRMNVGYSVSIDRLEIIGGPVIGYDRILNRFMPLNYYIADSARYKDTTVNCNQWLIGLQIALKFNLNKFLSIIGATNIGYVNGQTVNFSYLNTAKYSKLDIIENKIGVVINIK